MNVVDVESARAALGQWFSSLGQVAVAVSGGVDSMTLAAVAHRAIGERAQMFHAVSPAVPSMATARVRDFAKREGWVLELVDAGEFEDPRYIANPVNRCFFCKQNLYATVAQRTDLQTVSGANVDDLGDYRPGLEAARERAVRHPYIELQIDKQGVRAVAASMGFDELSELPSSPCLSSRVETGLRIQPGILQAIDHAEQQIALRVRSKTIRCRVRAETIVVELDAETLAQLDVSEQAEISALVAAGFKAAEVDWPVRFESYRRGSAFVHPIEVQGAKE